MASNSHPHCAWITGAGKGIGRALALRLAEDGWTVAASARTQSDLTALVEAAADLPGKVVAFPLDITDATAVALSVARVERDVGPIDLAVLNAGISQPITASNFDAEAISRIVETNLMGTVHCLAAILPRFLARRSGHVAVIGSLAGYCGLPTAAGYGPTKAALINMCEALKPELDAAGVRMQIVNPGFVETALATGYGVSLPYLISDRAAADTIARGLRSERFEIAFPRRMVWRMKMLQSLPYSLFFAITRRLTPPHPPRPRGARQADGG